MNEKRPTPEAIDDLCIAYDHATIAEDHARQEVSRVKGQLLEAVQNFGYTPAHADKTMRLEGTIYVASATTSSTIEIDDAKVEELQSELSRLKKPRIFSSLFQRRVKYSPVKDAGDTIKLAIGALSEETQKHLLAIFACCFRINPKAPSLSVDLGSALRAKEEAAAKRAARKAKK